MQLCIHNWINGIKKTSPYTGSDSAITNLLTSSPWRSTVILSSRPHLGLTLLITLLHVLHACVLQYKLTAATWIRGQSCAQAPTAFRPPLRNESAHYTRPTGFYRSRTEKGKKKKKKGRKKRKTVDVSHIRGEPEPSYRPSPPSVHRAYRPNAIWIRSLPRVYYCQGYQPEGSLFSSAHCSEQ